MIPHVCRSHLSMSLKVKNPSQLKSLHVTFAIPALFFSSLRDSKSIPIPMFDYLTERHQLPSEAALKVSQSIAYIKNPENSDSVMSFLKQSGFSNFHVENVVKRFPQVLFADVENTLKPKIKVFEGFGFSSKDIVEIVSANPWTFLTGTNTIASSIVQLTNVLGSIDNVTKILKLSTCIVARDLEKTMVPSIEYMKSCGINSSQIIRYLLRFPRLFMYRPETIEYFVKKADEMGSARQSKMFLSAVRVLSSMSGETWEQKLQLFRDLGFSDHDIRYMFQKAPSVFALSEKNIRNSTEFLLSINNDISYIVRNPVLLLRSMEGALKPRLAVLEILERKKIITKKPGLVAFLTISQKKFLEKYVIPYSDEVGRVYMT